MTVHTQGPTPTDITLDREQHELRITWKDNHQSTYPLDALREACPCASCRGGHEYMGEVHTPNLLELQPARPYQVFDIQLVGGYAIQISWDDGHSAGIYTWGYLRRLCPCEYCETARRAAQGGE